MGLTNQSELIAESLEGDEFDAEVARTLKQPSAEGPGIDVVHSAWSTCSIRRHMSTLRLAPDKLRVEDLRYVGDEGLAADLDELERASRVIEAERSRRLVELARRLHPW